MRICVISDTHELESEVQIPPCTLLLHCGDWSFFGKNLKAMDAFNGWLGEQPAEYALITAGNHEYPVVADPEKWRQRMSNAILLLDESVTVAGVKIWGSPVTPLAAGAFGINDERDRERLYSTIPDDTDRYARLRLARRTCIAIGICTRAMATLAKFGRSNSCASWPRLILCMEDAINQPTSAPWISSISGHRTRGPLHLFPALFWGACTGYT
jgi:hypothetical protein